jgi:hypothetical protein
MDKLVELAGGDKYHRPRFTDAQQAAYDKLFAQKKDLEDAHAAMKRVKKLYKDIQAAERRENPDWVWIDQRERRMKALAEGATQ